MSFTPSVLPAPIFGVRPVRVVAGRPATITLKITDASGNALDATGSVSYALTNGAGTQLATGTATHGATGVYTATVAPPLPDQDVLTWIGTVGGVASTTPQLLNVVGQRLVDLPTLQADPSLSGFTADQLTPVMDAVEDTFDEVLGFPCVPVGARVEFWLSRTGVIESYPTVTGIPYGLGPPRLLVPQISRPIYVIDALHWFGPVADLNLVKVGNTGALEYADGRPWPPGPYRLWLVHGMNPPPGDLRQAASTLIRYLARTDSNVPERAASVTSGGSTIVVALPTPDRPSGLPSVDVVLNRYRQGGAGGIAI